MKSNKPWIGIDLDDTLADSMETQLRVLRRVENRDIKKSDIVSIDIPSEFERLQLNLDVAKEVYKSIWERNTTIRPLDAYTVETMGMISSEFSIIILTSSIASEEQIKEWCQRNKIFYDHIVKLLSNEKLEFAKESKICTFVDDHPKFKVVSNMGKNLILIRQPWNRDIKDDPENVHLRVADSWQGVRKLLRL